MKFKIEEYIEKYKEQFDIEPIDEEKTWEDISKKKHLYKIQHKRYFSIAAVIAVLLTVGTIFLILEKNSVNKTQHFSLAEISQELAIEEIQLRNLFQQKYELLIPRIKNTAQYDFFVDEIKQIDKLYEDYIVDLKELGNNPRIVAGLLRCYEKKIKLVEKTTKEINKRERVRF